MLFLHVKYKWFYFYKYTSKKLKTNEKDIKFSHNCDYILYVVTVEGRICICRTQNSNKKNLCFIFCTEFSTKFPLTTFISPTHKTTYFFDFITTTCSEAIDTTYRSDDTLRIFTSTHLTFKVCLVSVSPCV